MLHTLGVGYCFVPRIPIHGRNPSKPHTHLPHMESCTLSTPTAREDDCPESSRSNFSSKPVVLHLQSRHHTMPSPFPKHSCQRGAKAHTLTRTMQTPTLIVCSALSHTGLTRLSCHPGFIQPQTHCGWPSLYLSTKPNFSLT